MYTYMQEKSRLLDIIFSVTRRTKRDIVTKLKNIVLQVSGSFTIMSMTFVSGRQRREPTQQTVQSLLDENSQLIQAIVDYQSKGKAYECTQYQQLLHRNLVYLATLADSSQSMQNTLTQTPSSQTGPAVIKSPPVSVTPPSAGGMLQPGLPDAPTSTGPSADMMPNTSSMSAGMPDPMNSSVPPPSLGGMSNTTAGVYGSGTVSGMGQSTSSPPQLQHPPMTAQSPMGYPNPSPNPTGRPVAPPMANLPPQVPNQAHVPPVGQHMMSQNQQQSQQYLMQQRQIQYRQNTSQQMPPQQQPLSHNPPPYGPPAAGMPSGNMLPPYHTQQQSQRYTLYRPSPQQQGLSHMPYPGQQQAPTMQGPPMMAQQPPMGQSPVGQTTMQQPPLV